MERAPPGVDLVTAYRVGAGGMWTSQPARRAGMKAQTPQHDERRGLLASPPRSAGGLDEIEELFGLADGGTTTAPPGARRPHTRPSPGGSGLPVAGVGFQDPADRRTIKCLSYMNDA